MGRLEFRHETFMVLRILQGAMEDSKQATDLF